MRPLFAGTHGIPPLLLQRQRSTFPYLAPSQLGQGLAEQAVQVQASSGAPQYATCGGDQRRHPSNVVSIRKLQAGSNCFGAALVSKACGCVVAVGMLVPHTCMWLPHVRVQYACRVAAAGM